MKARIVAETLERGARVKDVAERHGVQPQQVTAWRRLVRSGKLAIPAERETEFAALVIDPAAVERSSEAPSNALLEIAVGDVAVRLPGDTSAARIAEIARALRP